MFGHRIRPTAVRPPAGWSQSTRVPRRDKTAVGRLERPRSSERPETMSDVHEYSPEDFEPRLEPAPLEEGTADWPGLEEPADDSPPPEGPSNGPALADEWGRAIEALGDRLSQ